MCWLPYDENSDRTATDTRLTPLADWKMVFQRGVAMRQRREAVALGETAVSPDACGEVKPNGHVAI